MTTATESASDWLSRFGAALEAGDIDAAAAMFAAESYWRDLVSFTWNIKTLEGPAEIADMLRAQLEHVQPAGFALVGDANEADGVVDGWFDFETAVARGHGHVRLRDGECWTLLTTMVELKGYEEPRLTERPKGVEHGAFKDRLSWLERKQAAEASLGYEVQPYCVIVGGGQGGIALGARLRQLDVPTIIVEKNPRPGDSWRQRYKSLCLHDPVWYDHLPYVKFPENWPVFSPKDKIADWLEAYTKVMELTYWGSSTVTHADYDEGAGEWTVDVVRRHDDGTEEQVVLQAEAARVRDRHVGRPERARRSPAPTSSRATSTTPARTRTARRTPGASASCSAPTTRPTTSAPPCGSTAPT